MTREDLSALAPLVPWGPTQVVRYIDIPHPWRSEFHADSYGSTTPDLGVAYSRDWQRWLEIRFSGRYKPLRPIFEIVTDEIARTMLEEGAQP